MNSAKEGQHCTSRGLYFFYGKGKSSITYSFFNQRIVLAVKRVEFLSGRISYIVLRCCWCDIIALNAHASTADKSEVSKDSFCEELEQVFDHFPKYHIKSW
jgi:hypothetical protein